MALFVVLAFCLVGIIIGYKAGYAVGIKEEGLKAMNAVNTLKLKAELLESLNQTQRNKIAILEKEKKGSK